jgi:transketolase C-terminal domain/subunit
MAGAIESTAVFEQRSLAIGLSRAEFNATVAAGFSTMGRLAFACSYQPGAADETAFMQLPAGSGR